MSAAQGQTAYVLAPHAYRDLDERGLVDLNETPGMRAAEASGIGFEVARTERPSSAEESASLQGMELGQLLRTIVIRRGADDYVFVLVPGGRQIDWPKLRAHLGVKRLSLPSADEAKEATGYERGTITPFGATHAWPVVADAATQGFDVVAIGAGAHGVNLLVDTSALLAVLNADVADVTHPEETAPTP